MPVAVRQPRPRGDRAGVGVIGDGFEVLSADDGGPLAERQRIIDPLVLRLRSDTSTPRGF